MYVLMLKNFVCVAKVASGASQVSPLGRRCHCASHRSIDIRLDSAHMASASEYIATVALDGAITCQEFQEVKKTSSWYESLSSCAIYNT